MISLLQMSSQAMALGWFAMMVGAARSTCVGPVPYLEEANVFRDQGRGGTWFRLNPQVPQAPTALSACGGGSSIVAEVFAGPTCDNLALHATLVLQCERWSLVALTTGVPGYLRVLGAGHGDRVVLRQKVLAAPTCTGAAAAEGAEAAKAPSIADRTEADDARPRASNDSVWSRPLEQKPHGAAMPETDPFDSEVFPESFDSRARRAYASHRLASASVEADDCEYDVHNASQLFGRLSNSQQGGMNLTVCVRERIELDREITIVSKMNVTFKGVGTEAGFDAQHRSRVMKVCTSRQPRHDAPISS